MSALVAEDKKIGPSIILKVMSGDKINLVATSWYNSFTDNGVDNSLILDDLMNILSDGINLKKLHNNPGTIAADPGLNTSINHFFDIQDGGDIDDRPRAYLNWILLDEQFKLVEESSGFEQVSDPNVFKLHAFNNLPITKNGYLFVYVSNASSTDYVYFDNLQVSHIRGPLLEETHYYPFGLIMSGISSNSNGSLINKYKFGGNEIEVNGFCDNIGLGVYDFHFRYYDPQIGRWWSVDPKADKYFSWSLFNYTLNNPTNLVDPDGQEPIKPQAGTSATFIKVFNNTPSKMGLSFGKEASQALQRLGSTEWNSKQMRPLPTTTPYFNNREGRYIYTEKGGWIDMVHFLFYAGKAYDYKQQKADAVNLIKSLKESGVSTKDMPPNLISKSLISPVGEAVQDGYVQEMTDRYAAKYSAYSYEDLPSDKFGADFGANYFDPNSKLTLGEQLLNYLNDKLKATNPERAPNYKSLPSKEPTDKPSRTNHSTFPVYIINNP